jgi:hypothetical protein
MDRCRLPLQRSVNATFDQLLTRDPKSAFSKMRAFST